MAYKPINPRFLNRNTIGFYNTIFKFTYHNHPDDLNNIIRLNKQQFDFLVALIGPKLVKTSIRKPISPIERIVLTLR